ncbi:MAG: hypothetical protein ICCCNLDF_03487 [Planctomycetes bacterium]|nr:hypothetical protein [Planctomycetota bacterium]
MARKNVIALNLPDWSMRMLRVSFLVTASSIQLPRSGITQQVCMRRLSGLSSKPKSTPGLRCSWFTITRSAPLMMNSPPPIIRGSSPRYTSSSTDSPSRFRRIFTTSGAP